MNKKVIISLVLIAVMAFGTAIGTFAYFTSQATSIDNVFQAGTLKIAGPGSNGIASGILDVRSIYPGWEQTKTVNIQNTGSLPFKYKVSATTPTENALWNGENGLRVMINGGEPMHIYGLSNYLLGTILPGQNKNITFTFTLPTAAGNEFQALMSRINFAFDATQIENNDANWQAMGLVNVYQTGQNAANRTANRPHINYTVDGNKITLEFVNPTNANFAFDYRVDGEDGVHGEWADTVLKEGELIGQEIGASYNVVNVPPYETRTVTVTVAEEIWAGLRLGGEQNWFLDWIKFEVK